MRTEIGILATGSYLPKEVMSSAEIADRVGVEVEWILRKTMIAERRFAGPDEATSDLAAKAGADAIDRGGLTAEDIDFIIVSTSTPDSPQPPVACLVQAQIGAWNAACFDINVVCSGFVYALELARSLVETKPAARVLVIAADVYSRSLDFGDRRTAVLLGDGAGAAVVGRVPAGYGIIATHLASRGDQQQLIRVEAGGSRFPASHETVDSGGHYFRMDGRDVRDFVMENVPIAVGKFFAENGISHSEVAHVVPHQPNGVLLGELIERVGLGHARTHRTLERYGNVGSASVPVTLDDANRAGALHTGDLVLLTAFGGGMSMGHCLMRWTADRA
ncbi:3-oxoacyl-ACP synthase III family protein [Nocardia sp. NPDC051052]|uniref:3-oxoacyl-ACP synthase III family protein n=1 Tax=Nocardia sp. NPDC051052 TaxID=3364322 RepID=UPI0037A47B09